GLYGAVAVVAGSGDAADRRLSGGLWADRGIHLRAVDPAGAAAGQPDACLHADRAVGAVSAALRDAVRWAGLWLADRARRIRGRILSELRAGGWRGGAGSASDTAALRA